MMGSSAKNDVEVLSSDDEDIQIVEVKPAKDLPSRKEGRSSGFNATPISRALQRLVPIKTEPIDREYNRIPVNWNFADASSIIANGKNGNCNDQENVNVIRVALRKTGCDELTPVVPTVIVPVNEVPVDDPVPQNVSLETSKEQCTPASASAAIDKSQELNAHGEDAQNNLNRSVAEINVPSSTPNSNLVETPSTEEQSKDTCDAPIEMEKEEDSAENHIMPEKQLSPRSPEKAANEENENNERLVTADPEILPRLRVRRKAIYRRQSVHILNNGTVYEKFKFTSKQIQILLAAFRKTKYPQPFELDALAISMDVSFKRVKNWFHNERAKRAKEAKERKLKIQRSQKNDIHLQTKEPNDSGNDNDHQTILRMEIDPDPEMPVLVPQVIMKDSGELGPRITNEHNLNNKPIENDQTEKTKTEESPQKRLEEFFKQTPYPPIITEINALVLETGLKKRYIMKWIRSAWKKQCEIVANSTDGLVAAVAKQETTVECWITTQSKKLQSLDDCQINELWKSCQSSFEKILQLSSDDASSSATLTKESKYLQEELDCHDCIFNPTQVDPINKLNNFCINCHIDSWENEENDRDSLFAELDSLLSPWTSLILLAKYSKSSIYDTVTQFCEATDQMDMDETEITEWTVAKILDRIQ